MSEFGARLFEFAVGLVSVQAAQVRHPSAIMSLPGSSQADTLHGFEVESSPVGACHVDVRNGTYIFRDGSRARIVHERNDAGKSIRRVWARV